MSLDFGALVGGGMEGARFQQDLETRKKRQEYDDFRFGREKAGASREDAYYADIAKAIEERNAASQEQPKSLGAFSSQPEAQQPGIAQSAPTMSLAGAVAPQVARADPAQVKPNSWDYGPQPQGQQPTQPQQAQMQMQPAQQSIQQPQSLGAVQDLQKKSGGIDPELMNRLTMATAKYDPMKAMKMQMDINQEGRVGEEFGWRAKDRTESDRNQSIVKDVAGAASRGYTALADTYNKKFNDGYTTRVIENPDGSATFHSFDKDGKLVGKSDFRTAGEAARHMLTRVDPKTYMSHAQEDEQDKRRDKRQDRIDTNAERRMDMQDTRDQRDFGLRSKQADASIAASRASAYNANTHAKLAREKFDYDKKRDSEIMAAGGESLPPGMKYQVNAFESNIKTLSNRYDELYRQRAKALSGDVMGDPKEATRALDGEMQKIQSDIDDLSGKRDALVFGNRQPQAAPSAGRGDFLNLRKQ